MSRPRITPRDGEASTADKLRALRETAAAQERALRLRRAVEALRACGMGAEVTALLTARLVSADVADRFDRARAEVQYHRARLADGGNEPRDAACIAALEALGALWAVSS